MSASTSTIPTWVKPSDDQDPHCTFYGPLGSPAKRGQLIVNIGILAEKNESDDGSLSLDLAVSGTGEHRRLRAVVQRGAGDEYHEWSETPLTFELDSKSDIPKLQAWVTELAIAALDAAEASKVSLFSHDFVRTDKTEYELDGACLRSMTDGRKGKKKVPVWLKVSVYNPPDLRPLDKALSSRTAQSGRASTMQSIQEE